MEFAIVVDTAARGDTRGLSALVEQAVLAETLGFAAACVPDHYVFESFGVLQRDAPAHELFLVLATLAQRTRRLRLVSHVACVPFRHPAMLARLFAQVDEASGGRVIAGVGAGWTRAEFEMMGIDFPPVATRLRMLDEAVAVMRGLWRGEPLDFRGDHYRLTAAVCRPLPLQRPGPPLMLGGSGTGILRRAGAWADIVHLVPALGAAGTTTVEAVRDFGDVAFAARLARVRAAEAAAGRPPGTVRAASTVFSYAMTSSPRMTESLAARLGGPLGLSAAELRRHPSALVGTPEEMVAELERRQRAHGLTLLAFHFPSTRHLQEFGDKVLPLVARADDARAG